MTEIIAICLLGFVFGALFGLLTAFVIWIYKVQDRKREGMKEILDVIHKTIYQFFDVCGDEEEVPISDKDKLLLEVNKAICDNLKALEQESILDKIRYEVLEYIDDIDIAYEICGIFDKYSAESEAEDGKA